MVEIDDILLFLLGAQIGYFPPDSVKITCSHVTKFQPSGSDIWADLILLHFALWHLTDVAFFMCNSHESFHILFLLWLDGNEHSPQDSLGGKMVKMLNP